MKENIEKILEKYNEFANFVQINLPTSSTTCDIAREKAKACLDLEFEIRVRDSFEYVLNRSFYNKETIDMIKSLKENDFISLIINFNHVSNICDLFIKYWNRMGEIIIILKKYVEELEEEEKKDEKEDE